jgi:nitrogen fixation-related uncharacterized protein
MDKNKLILPASIILSCIILGVFYYASEMSKLQFTEKQKQLDRQEDINKENESKMESYRKECIAKKEENIKEYEDFLNTCTGKGGNSIDYCIGSPVGKMYTEEISEDFLESCISNRIKTSY